MPTYMREGAKVGQSCLGVGFPGKMRQEKGGGVASLLIKR